MVYVFFLRPRSQAARRQRDTLMELSAGDEVLTGAGIFGTVLDVEPDRVTLETAPGTRITVLRSTIARRITEPDGADSEWDEHDEDEAHDAYRGTRHAAMARRRGRRARRRGRADGTRPTETDDDTPATRTTGETSPRPTGHTGDRRQGGRDE